MSSRERVNGELARRANLVLHRYGAKSTGPSNA
jgi:hypothetical protein